MLRVTVQLDSALPLLELLQGHLDSPDQLLAPAVPVVAAAIERNFDEEGRPVRWPPLSPRYALRKARFYAGRKILERTGRLRRSILTRVEGSALVASTDVSYAPAHQFGVLARHSPAGALAKAGLPARPFLVLTPDDLDAAAQAIAASLEGTGRGSLDTGLPRAQSRGHRQ